MYLSQPKTTTYLGEPMRDPFPRKKARLPPLGKALAAVHVVQEVMAERMDDKQVSSYLRQEVGLQWTLLTAFQYLTGQEAIGALRELPQGWVGEGDRKSVV